MTGAQDSGPKIVRSGEEGCSGDLGAWRLPPLDVHRHAGVLKQVQHQAALLQIVLQQFELFFRLVRCDIDCQANALEIGTDTLDFPHAAKIQFAFLLELQAVVFEPDGFGDDPQHRGFAPDKRSQRGLKWCPGEIGAFPLLRLVDKGFQIADTNDRFGFCFICRSKVRLAYNGLRWIDGRGISCSVMDALLIDGKTGGEAREPEEGRRGRDDQRCLRGPAETEITGFQRCADNLQAFGSRHVAGRFALFQIDNHSKLVHMLNDHIGGWRLGVGTQIRSAG